MERELAHTDACDGLLDVVRTGCEGWCDLLHHINCYSSIALTDRVKNEEVLQSRKKATPYLQ
jgi:hypothetical protein